MARVLSIPTTVPFLPTLADALLDGTLVAGLDPRADPLALAGVTLYLPTRRAGRACEAALLAASGGEGLILPRIIPLGDVDEDALAFSEDAPLLAPPQAVETVHRRIALSALVARWRDVLAARADQARVAAGPAATLVLADALANLFDQMTIAQVEWDRLETLVLDDLDPYFELSRDFLRIARKAWVAHLAEYGLVEPSVRRDLLVAAQARQLLKLGAAAGPVIAAGSTGSLPATRMLLAAIARLPQGVVVLPGLDVHAEEDAFAALTAPEPHPAPDHPQYGLAHLLAALGVQRRQVEPLGAPRNLERERLLSEAMRQSRTTERWADLATRLPDPARGRATAQVTLIEAADPREEALCVALVLREVLTRPGARGALVTHDRDLARRVRAELARFAIQIDDSAGEPLAETAAGRFARLVVQVAASDFAPVPLFALLTHPYATFGLGETARAEAVAALELVALRGPRPRAGLSGLAEAVVAFDPERLHRTDPRRRVDEAGLARAADLVARLEVGFRAFVSSAAPQRLVDLVAAHRAALAAIAAAPEFQTLPPDAPAPALPESSDPLAQTPDGVELEAAFEAIAGAAVHGPDLSLGDYAQTVEALLADQVVRPQAQPAARLRILGPLEARLLDVDRVVLGGLVEGIWPPQTQADPWLSRPMRAQLGLELPERRIGLSAHDFVQCYGAPEVVLSLPGKVEGTQSVPSRFVQRLATVCGAQIWGQARARGDAWRAAAAALDQGARVPRALQPAPTPPLALRPRHLSVTEIETFLRDPYSIFARHVLALQPLDPLDARPGGAERGSALHDALGAFTLAFPDDLPPDALDQLMAHGRAAFAPLAVFPAEHALWWERFRRVAAWMVAFERERRQDLRRVVAEIGGSITLSLPGGPFRLTGRADRIDLLRGGGLAIVDYKTGTAPSTRQGRAFSPQLPLEAAMAVRGGFRAVPAEPVHDFFYLELKGGAEPGRMKAGVPEGQEAGAMAQEALDRLTDLLVAFDDETQGYRALAAPQWRGRFGVYDHLARVREWALGAEEDSA